MNILKPTKSDYYKINGITLYGSAYLKHKVNKSLIELLKDEFSQNDIVYDIAMSITSEYGTDYHIEEMIKNLEAFYCRDLTYDEIESFIEAYIDCMEVA
tara:strand:+ start:335 stop:631 length:297 start_codon:yes stop_codon:yes gene_type:complete